MDNLLPRFIQAIMLKPELYEEVENNPNLLVQSLVILVWSGLARGVGRFGPLDFADIFKGLGISIGSYVIWVGLCYGIGTTILKGANTRTSLGELLRVLGFASAPGVFCLFGIFPLVGAFFYFLGTFWMILAMIVAIRQALDYPKTSQAALVVMAGFIPYLLLMKLIF